MIRACVRCSMLASPKAQWGMSVRRLSTQRPTPQRRSWLRVLPLSLAAGACYFVGAKYPPAAIPFLFSPYSSSASPISDEEELAHVHEIETALHKLPAVVEHISRSYETPSAKRLREAHGVSYGVPFADPKVADYVIQRPFSRGDPALLETMLTAGSLRGPHKFAVMPFVFSKTPAGAQRSGGMEGDGLVVVHFGKNMCGYKGIVHGGLLATVFDEALGRTAFYGLPSRLGVTGKLELSYRKPVRAERFYLVETRITESVGRKCFVSGSLLDPQTRQVMVEAHAVFIEPRWAKYISWMGTNIHKLLDG
ncbi:Similar to S.cerevisiae protein YBL095W (Putative protein of unknown function) [Malassezia sympodialis ATCC 42132]|uniref:Thioesterase domain-containing protein n=1 Tax=Malassezia sympodialis (strain ATCC 42132) TaxID=1230383 RepID=A0A1M8A0Z3_MALS4|nr:Similar to S.cerevisiae protein YBL095W (Putative protein of unknown function) [Malassezia sympodialis ATCC 42132]